MGRRRQKSSESITPQCIGDSSESGRSRDTSQVPEKKSCMHINKAVDQNDVRKHFKNPSSNLSKCVECESQELCVCLRCGVAVCVTDHAVKHEKTPRSDLHCMMLDTTKWTVWCYMCNSGVQVDANKKLKSIIDYIQGHIDKVPSPLPVLSSGTIPLGPPIPCDKKAELNSSSSSNMKKKGTSGPSGKHTNSQPCKIRGLANLGNTCFFNSVLQCLSQTPNLVEFLNELKDGGEEFTMPPVDEEECEMKGKLGGWGPLTEQLANTLGEMTIGSQAVYSPRLLLEELRKKCPQFRGYEQHDAHELLRELLNAVRTEDIKRYQTVILVKLFNSTKVNPKDLNEEDKAKAKRLGQKISDLVSTKPIDVFQGKTECVHQCQDCKHSTCKVEPFMDLSLPVLSEKPQPPNCKRNREDSTSEEPKMSKHQLKKLNKQKHRKGGPKGKKQCAANLNNKENNTSNCPENEDDMNEMESLAPNTSDKSNDKTSSESDGHRSSPVRPRHQESGYNSDKAQACDPVIHTAQAFMDSYVQHQVPPLEPLGSMYGSKASSILSYDEDFPAMSSLLDDDNDDVTAKHLDQAHIQAEQSFCEDPPLPIDLDFNMPSMQDAPSPHNEPASPSHIFVDTSHEAPTGSLFYAAGPWPPGPLTMESLKCIELSAEDVCSRSSSQFHESGFGSQSIDEVSSTHPSEGMCSTESCNGGPSLFGDEFQHVENKTSIPESGVGSMTEELATLSIIESDGDNGSPDSMQANRSSGSIHTLSPYSDDSSQKKNQLRSCNSLSNLSGEDLSCYVNANQPTFDHNYLSEKLLASSRHNNTDPDDGENERGEYDDGARDREEYGDKEQDNDYTVRREVKEEYEEDGDKEYEEDGEKEKDDKEKEELRDHVSTVGVRSHKKSEGDNEKDAITEEKEQDEESSVGNGKTLSPRLHGHNGECSLLSCLNQYTCIELLAGNNRVTCEMCTKKHNRGTNKTEPVRTAATLQTLIISPPSVLICHLKRFQLTYSSLKKITKSVPFPMKLSIGSFCSSKCQGITKDQTDVQYSLYGIVEHSGSLHGGHYVAYVKTSSGQWYYASDSRVNPVSEDRVLKAEAYLLFYHRIC